AALGASPLLDVGIPERAAQRDGEELDRTADIAARRGAIGLLEGPGMAARRKGDGEQEAQNGDVMHGALRRGTGIDRPSGFLAGWSAHCEETSGCDGRVRCGSARLAQVRVSNRRSISVARGTSEE